MENQEKTEEIKNPEEKNNMLLSVNILILNPGSGRYLLSVFGGNVPCNRNTPEMGF